MSDITCRYCNAPIKRVRLRDGKYVFCDADLVHYIPGGAGEGSSPDKIITVTGERIRGKILGPPKKGVLIGYRQHSMVCPLMWKSESQQARRANSARRNVGAPKKAGGATAKAPVPGDGSNPIKFDQMSLFFGNRERLKERDL